MASTSDFALLALRAYSTPLANDPDPAKRDTEFNRPAVPTGWTELEWHTDEADGFSYGVYQKGVEIALVYAGTGPGLDVDWVANLATGVGLSSTQTTKAALAYLAAKQQYGTNITFAGHSLGGGLASIMATWFDRPAVVFDEAPFELTARSPLVIGATYAALTAAGFSVGAFAGYNGITDFSAREANVRNYFTQNEALLYLRLAWPTIVGATDEVIVANVADMTSASAKIDLHSQALLTALVMSQNFQLATYVSSRILPLLMDQSFYAYSTKGANENVLINFIRSEQGAGDKLTHFASDLNKLGTNIAGLNLAAQNAIIAQGIEWYYWQSSNYAGQEFFTQTGQLLQYTSAIGAGLQGAQNKAASYINSWLTPIYNASGEFGGRVSFDQWNVSTSATVGVAATALNAAKSQIFTGQAGADNFTGGNLSDVILAGAGNDILNGGAGSDNLYGGAGTDTYTFSGNWGTDTVVDSDGLGSITINGTVLQGGKKVAGTEGLWVNTSQGITFALAGSGASQVLVITKDAGSSIRIPNWVNGQLGLTMDEVPGAAPAIAQTRNGDQRAPIIGVEVDIGTPTNNPLYNTYKWSSTAWTSSGTLTGGTAAGSFSDVIYATATNDKLNGLGGNDALAGGDGSDNIDGGDGDDLIAGGAGTDSILGGLGNDFINSSGGLTVQARLRPTDTWSGPPAGQTVLAQGANWGVYVETPSAGVTDTLTIWSDATNPAGTDGDFVDGGAGNDWVIAGGGTDFVQGGTGNDHLHGMGGNDVLSGRARNDMNRNTLWLLCTKLAPRRDPPQYAPR